MLIAHEHAHEGFGLGLIRQNAETSSFRPSEVTRVPIDESEALLMLRLSIRRDLGDIRVPRLDFR